MCIPYAMADTSYAGHSISLWKGLFTSCTLVIQVWVSYVVTRVSCAMLLHCETTRVLMGLPFRLHHNSVVIVKKTYPEENWKSFLPKLCDCHQLCPLLHPPTPKSEEEKQSQTSPNYSLFIGAMLIAIPAMSWAESLSPARPSTCQLLSPLPRGTRDSLWLSPDQRGAPPLPHPSGTSEQPQSCWASSVWVSPTLLMTLMIFLRL